MESSAPFPDEHDADYRLAHALCTAADAIQPDSDEPNDLPHRLLCAATSAWERYLRRERPASLYLASARRQRQWMPFGGKSESVDTRTIQQRAVNGAA